MACAQPGKIEHCLAVLRRTGIQIEDLEIRKADLEDVFIQLMQDKQPSSSSAPDGRACLLPAAP